MQFYASRNCIKLCKKYQKELYYYINNCLLIFYVNLIISIYCINPYCRQIFVTITCKINSFRHLIYYFNALKLYRTSLIFSYLNFVLLFYKNLPNKFDLIDSSHFHALSYRFLKNELYKNKGS